ncbi:ATP-dependent RecD-like DNA helicase [Candidatus Babeliales bacterium]|nr:ATP-dependent RecD-like DNA helicase [Candidatus Babeliales bacterium]
MNELVEIHGTLEKEIFKSKENGFSIFLLKVNAKTSIVVQGVLPQIHEGEQATFKGKWVFHPKFGRQFEALESKTQLPCSADGIKKYLASGLIKGIGPKFAEKLVNTFQEKTLEIIDKTPDMLLQINGVGTKKVEAIIKAWQDQKEIADIMLFLKSKDISTSFAVKIYKTYGKNSLQKIQEDPYRLVEDIWGVGFKTADALAIKLGIEPNSLQRIKSGILYCISQATNNGHLYVLLDDIKKDIFKILELEQSEENFGLLKNSLNQLYQEEKIKLISYENKNFLSLPQFYFSEKGISSKILKFLERKVEHEFNFDIIYNQIRKPDSNGIELNEDQQRGILTCLQNRITIITGGPGTGKTTLIKKLLECLKDNHIKFKLAAPTGRAAKRMFESTGYDTETIHRLLEFTPEIMSFNKNEQNALNLDFLIIDESSMLDVFLMHSLLKALPSKAHLVLLGDIDQLPSVGAGNILNDLINSNKIAIVKLTEIFRQAQDSLIIVNAHKVNKGEFPITSLQDQTSKKDFVYIKADEPENIFPVLHKIYKNKLPSLGISHDNSIVLTPMNKGIVGTNRINQELQMILNPESTDKQITKFGQVYKKNDRVMQIRNNYDKFIFNGDIGTILDINLEDQKLIINFGSRDLEYDFTELDEIVLSYSISIHKSQGSEFQAVIIPIFMQHFVLLQRNLIYTAITRAKKLCILIGQPKAIFLAIKNNKNIKRNTFLKEFLTTDLQAK